MKIDGYKVYIHKNKLNNKVYIGITSQPVNQRWRNGTNYYGNLYFNRAIKKYGWDNFEHIVLYENLTKEYAETKEVELIKKYNSTNRAFGYNIENGGNAKGKHSDEVIKKISESQKGDKNHMFGKVGFKNPKSKAVICLNTRIVYGSAREAERTLKLSKKVSDCCNEKVKTVGNINGERLVWMWYEEYLKIDESVLEDEVLKIFENSKHKHTTIPKYGDENGNAKKVMCLEDGNIFKCIKEACEYYSISPSTLSQNLNKKTKRCKSKKYNIYLHFNYYQSKEIKIN